MRVLVADDDAEVRTMLAEYLAQRGVEVVEAGDGVAALGQLTRSRLTATPFDALVLDLQMPRLGGVDALGRIRATAPDLPVIIVTGAMEPALHRQAQALGPRAIFSKPAQLAQLWAAIEAHAISSPADASPHATAGIARPEPRPATESKVLVVDDDPAVCEVLEEFLQSRGYQSTVVHDGTSAVRTLVTQPADIVLLDIHMPGLNGVDALPTLRAIAPNAAVIMVSANVDEALAKRALAYGAFDYLVKPVNFDHLARTLEMALELNALREEP